MMMKNASQLKKNQMKFQKKRNLLKVKVKGQIIKKKNLFNQIQNQIQNQRKIITRILDSQEGEEEEVIKKTDQLKQNQTKLKKRKNLLKIKLEISHQVQRLKTKKVDFLIL